MRIRTLAANILLPTCIALTIVAAWIWTTGSFRVSVQTGVGLAVAAGGASAVAEWLIRQAVYARRRRGRPSRHRAQARPNPRKAA
ncbi:hypothetical protein [Streptomyces osmaniensis]|uniref:Uncharacterized protein n=1 Tax=Streptomyces osmaniensis TaxID=593134 RepID=A0ABP6YVW9_9ACTN|nr:hypothetical protein KJK32_46690 [Streptomyces sp. JCM17656]